MYRRWGQKHFDVGTNSSQTTPPKCVQFGQVSAEGRSLCPQQSFWPHLTWTSKKIKSVLEETLGPASHNNRWWEHRLSMKHQWQHLITFRHPKRTLCADSPWMHTRSSLLSPPNGCHLLSPSGSSWSQGWSFYGNRGHKDIQIHRDFDCAVSCDEPIKESPQNLVIIYIPLLNPSRLSRACIDSKGEQGLCLLHVLFLQDF